MKKSNVFYNTVITLIYAFFLFSCRDFLDIKDPSSELISDKVFDNTSTINSAVTAVYSRTVNEVGISFLISQCGALSADELQCFSTNANVKPFFVNGISPTNLKLQSIWTNLYSYIYHCNSVMEGVANNNITESAKSQFDGEMLFMRGFFHLILSNFFGDLPLVLTTSYKDNAIIPRSSLSSVYKQIQDDLEKASLLLGGKYVGADGITISTERVRANRWAALALLSRLYVYTKDYSKAIANATLVINNNELFQLDSNLNNVFLKNNKEQILQLQPYGGGINTPEGANFVLSGAPSSGEFNNSVLGESILKLLDSTDKRRTSWTKTIGVGGKTYVFPYKYKVVNATTVTEYVSVLRLGEVYLNRAEARLGLEDLSGARSDLNVIRKRAGIAMISTANKDSLRQYIIQERFRELFTEWGHRWIDIKRMGIADSVMMVVTPQKGGEWKADFKLWPIPQNDLNADPFLIQNPGYN